MKHETDETIAAFLDGKRDPELILHLMLCRECYELFVEAARAVIEVE